MKERKGDVWCTFLSWPPLVVFSLLYPAHCFFTTLGAQKCATLILGEVFLERQPTWEGGVTVSRKKVRKLTHNHSMLPWVRRGMSLSPVWSMSACYCPPYKVSGPPFFSHYYPPSSQALTVPGAKEHTTRLGLGGSRDVEVMLFRLHFCLNDHKSGVHL